jgi:hypothetical protein
MMMNPEQMERAAEVGMSASFFIIGLCLSHLYVMFRKYRKDQKIRKRATALRLQTWVYNGILKGGLR